MTDKQMIIDGIDVSGCESFCNGICCKVGFGDDASCKLFSDCHYKLYKRKEQECEELRQYHNKCCEENAKKETEWLEKYNQNSRGFCNGDYCNTEHCSLLKAKEQECEKWKAIIGEAQIEQGKLQQLDELKKENEESKNAYTRLNSLYNDNCNYTYKLEQTLTEIAEMCNSVENIENVKSLYDAALSGMYLQAKKILQKINECDIKEFNFNSYTTNKQSISYCEVDKCKIVVKLQEQLNQLKADNMDLKKQLESTKGFVTVGNRQLVEALKKNEFLAKLVRKMKN